MNDQTPPRRYFLVAYSWIGDSRCGAGNLWFGMNGYPSNKWIKQQAQDDLGPVSVVVTGITEMTAEDFEAFQA